MIQPLPGPLESIAAEALRQRIAALELMDLAALRRTWIGVVKTTPNLRLSADLLRRLPYVSLTRIAREITGAAWAGPRFFGLVKTGPARRISGEADRA